MILKKFLRASAITGCFFICSCGNSDKQIRDITSRRIGVEQAKDVKINYSLGGKAKAHLTGPLMLRYQDTVPYIEFPKTIHVDFYDDSGAIESRLDALYARYMESESKVYLRDSIKIINRKGDTLYCKELYWDRSRPGREFYTDKPVRIRTKDKYMDGDGMEASQDFKNPLLLNPRGTVKVPASQFPQ